LGSEENNRQPTPVVDGLHAEDDMPAVAINPWGTSFDFVLAKRTGMTCISGKPFPMIDRERSSHPSVMWRFAAHDGF